MSIDLLGVLRAHFGYASLRPGQLDIVSAVLAGRDVLAVLPTGSGKSLCYQLPACLPNAFVVVVSPLIALIDDQVAALRRRGVAAAALHGGCDDGLRRRVMAEVAAGRCPILYLAPERLAQPAVLHVLRARGVSVLAVDEAHCISAWGHDFRPAYRHLGAMAEQLAPRVRMALTATATPAVQREIITSLRLRGPFVHVGGFHRPNLWLRVASVAPERRLTAVTEALAARGDGAAIIYAATRAQTEQTARALGVPCYHAGLSHEVRTQVQERFVCGEAPVIVATNAFGLGVDKPDVRAVIHLQMPGSLEAYVQETGRGGRDGLPSRCVLLRASGDDDVHRVLAERACPNEGVAATLLREAARGRLRDGHLHEVPGVGPHGRARAQQTFDALLLLGALRVGDFGRVEVVAENLDVLPTVRRHRLRRLQLLRRMAWFATMRRGCRQAALVDYFGQSLPGGHCGTCDLCGGA